MAHTKHFGVVGTALFLLLQSFAGSSVAGEKVLSRTTRQAHQHDHGHVHGPGVVENFVIVGNYLLEEELSAERASRDFESNHDGVISALQVENLISSLFYRLGCEQRVDNCTKCSSDIKAHLYSALNLNETDGLSEDALHESSPLLLYILRWLEPLCAAAEANTLGEWSLEEGVVFGDLMLAGNDGDNTTLSEADLAEILHEIGENYTATTQASCFDVESLFIASVSDHEAGANASETHAVAESVVANLLLGYCIGAATLPSTEAFTDAIFNTYAHGGAVHEEDFAAMLGTLGIGGSVDTAHAGHAHRRRRDLFSAAVAAGEMNPTHSRQRRVVDPHGHAHETGAGVPNVTETCFTGEELLTIFGVDHAAGLSETQFNSIAPSVVQQVLSGACIAPTTQPSSPSTAEVWGYGTLAVVIISLCAVVGAVFVPCMSGFVYEMFIQTLIALAVATLTGDALLHLIPQAVGLHAHDSSVTAHTSHGPTNPELAFVWKCLVVQMAVYAFFLLEALSSFMPCGAHTHSHGGTQVEMAESDLARRNSARVYKSSKASSKSESKRNLSEEENGNGEKKPGFWAGFGPVPLMIILGDSLHNFGDGLAIGAAFSAGLGPGISTSIAVMCHELPHEFGDLAVLLNQGMSLSSAVSLNFLSACTALIGLWIGIPISQNQTARQWIFAATAGTFLYVGLVSMLPQLHAYRGKRRGVIFALQNLGFLVGSAIILVIALYEDAIAISI